MVRPCEVALASEHVLAHDGLPPERSDVVDRTREVAFVPQRTRWRDECHSCPLAQQWRSSRTPGSRLFVIHITPWHMRCPTQCPQSVADYSAARSSSQNMLEGRRMADQNRNRES